MSDSIIYESNSPEETAQIAERMATDAVAGQVICLTGDLGVGKTAFAQGFGRGLGITEPMASPTFTILREYHDGRLPLYHYDVYRISDADELVEVGFYDFMDEGVSLVEWAELIEDEIPQDAVWVRIEKDVEKGFDYRRISVGSR